MWLAKGEDQSVIWVDPNSRRTDSMWIPWVGDDSEVRNKSIRFFYTDTSDQLFYIFQDYWAPNDQVRFFWTPKYYEHAPAVKGGTGGGRKRLIIYPSDFAMERVG